MALSTAQKNEIHRRANAGESGANLAKEFGVSASAISNLKNHYKPEETVVENTVSVANTEVTTATPATTTKKRVVIVNSTKHINARFETSAKTLGEFLGEIRENSQIKAIFQGSKKETLEKSSDLLPDTGDQPLYLYFVPLKTNAGK